MSLECQRCGKCCSDPSLFVMVTHRDVLRLEYFSPDLDFFKVLAFYQIPDKDKTLEKKLMSPKIITNRGETFLGLQKKEDKCIFLEDKTCQIYEVRPLICRSFPYTFQVRGDQIYWGYTTKAKEYCISIQKGTEVDKDTLEHLASDILKESKEFEQLIDIWNYLAQNSLIDPTPELLLQFITGKIKLSIEQLEK